MNITTSSDSEPIYQSIEKYKHYLSLVGGIIGLLGSTWVIFQFTQKQIIISQSTSRLICAIAFVDLFCSLLYIILSFFSMTQVHGMIIQILLQWSIVAYAYLNYVLVAFALSLVFSPSLVKMIDRFQMTIILCCLFLLPFLLFFIPISLLTSLLTGQSISQVVPSCFFDECPTYTLVVYIYTLVLILGAIVSSITAYFILKWRLSKSRAISPTPEQSTLLLSKTLYMYYLLLSSIIWIPSLGTFISLTLSSGGLLIWISSCLDLLTSMRGYLHALILVNIYKSNAKDQSFGFVRDLLLLTRLITEDEIERDSNAHEMGDFWHVKSQFATLQR